MNKPNIEKTAPKSKKGKGCLGFIIGLVLFICIGGFFVIGYFATTTIWQSIQIQQDCQQNGNCPEIILEETEEGRVIRPRF